MSLADYLTEPPRISRPWQSLVLAPEVSGIESMLSGEEKRYLCWLTAEKFEGWGAVVDLGPWLGSSSAALAEGLKRRGSKAKVQSFDLFRWEPDYMEPVARTGLAAGEDFLPFFLRATDNYAAWIDARREDLTNYRWDGGPIEILFVDAAKSWDLTNAIFRGFGPFLEAGRTRVVLQDFRYHETHWLPLIFDSRPDLWEQIEDVSEGHTVTFRPLRSLTGPVGIQTDYSEEAFPLPAAERLLRNRIAMEEPSQRRFFLRMLYRKYLLDGSPEEACKVKDELLASGAASDPEMAVEDLEHMLVPRGWSAYDREDYVAAEAIARRALRTSRARAEHALTLLAFSVLKMGDRDSAARIFREVLSIAPTNIGAGLGCAEIAIAEGRLREAEETILQVIGRCAGEEGTVRWALDLLSDAWAAGGQEESHLKVLAELRSGLASSPAFFRQLAAEQRKAGLIQDSRNSLETALGLGPEDDMAAPMRAEWYALAENEGESPATGAAGCLHRPEIPARLPALAEITLGDLSSEILARADEGAFAASEETILLGLELDEVLRKALELHNNRFSRRRYRDLYECFYEYVEPRAPLEGATIVDLGCGSLNPFGFLFLFLMLGARRGIAIDPDGIHDWPRAARALAALAADMTVAAGEIIGSHPIDRERMMRNSASFDLAMLSAGDRSGIDPARLVHRADSVHALSLETGEADVIFSNATLEHIPAVPEAIAELARVTRPGGMGVHVIDCSDHRRYHDPKVHPLQFLTESHAEALAYGSNRLRPDQFATIFERNGFDVVNVIPFEHADVGAKLRGQMAQPFKDMSAEALTVTIAKLVVRRRS